MPNRVGTLCPTAWPLAGWQAVPTLPIRTGHSGVPTLGELVQDFVEFIRPRVKLRLLVAAAGVCHVAQAAMVAAVASVVGFQRGRKIIDGTIWAAGGAPQRNRELVGLPPAGRVGAGLAGFRRPLSGAFPMKRGT